MRLQLVAVYLNGAFVVPNVPAVLIRRVRTAPMLAARVLDFDGALFPSALHLPAIIFSYRLLFIPLGRFLTGEGIRFGIGLLLCWSYIQMMLG